MMTTRSNPMSVARLAGIQINANRSWLIFVGLISFGMWGQLRISHPDLAVVSSLTLAIAGVFVLFGSVLLHEFAHAVSAQRRGIEVTGITLYLFGGATETKTSSESPSDKLVIAIAGPLTSLAVAIVLGGLSILAGPSGEPLPDLLGSLALLNLLLAALNMIPGLPLDGGRVFRAIVWALTGDAIQATRWARSAGISFGYALIALGLLASWQSPIAGIWIVGIGWFISQSARQSWIGEHLRSTLKGLTAADVMTTPVITIPSGTLVAEAVRHYFGEEKVTVFPVADDGRLVGLLAASVVHNVPNDKRWSTTVEQIAVNHQPVLIARPTTPVLEVISSFADGPRTKARVLVAEENRLVGIISPTDLIRDDVFGGLGTAGP